MANTRYFYWREKKRGSILGEQELREEEGI